MRIKPSQHIIIALTLIVGYFIYHIIKAGGIKNTPIELVNLMLNVCIILICLVIIGVLEIYKWEEEDEKKNE